MELFAPETFDKVVEGTYIFKVNSVQVKAVVATSLDPNEQQYRAKVYRVSDGLYLLNEKVTDHYKDDFIKTLTTVIQVKGYA